MAQAQTEMGSPRRRRQRERDEAGTATLEDRFLALGGYAAEAEAASIASNLSCPTGSSTSRCRPSRVVSAAASSSPASCSPASDTMLLDEPTNHLDADSVVWLREFLKNFQGGLIVISHDVELVEDTVNQVFYLDANRQADRPVQHGLEELPAPARGRRGAPQEGARQRREEGGVAAAAGRQVRREGVEGRRRAPDGRARREAARAASTRCARWTASPSCASPTPRRAARPRCMATTSSKSYGSLEIFTAVDLAIDRGSKVVILGLNGAGKTTLLRILAGVDAPDTGIVEAGHGLRIGYYAQEHETIDVKRSVLENMVSSSPDIYRDRGPSRARLVPVHRG